MQNEKFSIKRVAVGVLVGFVAVTAFAGVGSLTQANVFNDLFSWLTAQEYYDDPYMDTYNDPYMDTYNDPYMDTYDDPYVDPYVDDYVDPYVDDYVDPYVDPYVDDYVDPYVDPYVDDYVDPYVDPYVDDNYQDCGTDSYWDSYYQTCMPIGDDDYYYDDGTQCWDSAGNYICEDDYYYDDGTYPGEDDGYDASSCTGDCYWDTDHCECPDGQCPEGCDLMESSYGSYCECPWDYDTYYDETMDCGPDGWEECDSLSCWCEYGDYDYYYDDSCYYDYYGDYVCGDSGYDDYYYEDDYYYDDYYYDYNDYEYDDSYDYYDSSELYCNYDEFQMCDDWGCWCEQNTYEYDPFDIYCGYDQIEVCDSWGCWCEFDMYEYDSYFDDYSYETDFYFDDSWDDFYYWEDGWGVDCYKEYGEEWFPNDEGGCDDHTEYGYWECTYSGMMYDSWSHECHEDYYGNYGEYDWGMGDDEWDWGSTWGNEDYYYDEWDDWSWEDDFSDEWFEEEKEYMADKLYELDDRDEDVENVRWEVEEWLEEVDWRCEEFQEDFDDYEHIMTAEMKDLYADAIAFCVLAKENIESLEDSLDDLEADAEEAKESLEDVYEEVISTDGQNVDEFWDLADSTVSYDLMDIYRSQAEIWGRLLNFWEFKMEGSRIEMETGVGLYELGDEMTEAVAFADFAIESLQDVMLNELPSLISDAMAAIDQGMDSWRAMDAVWDFFDDQRDVLDEDMFMWNALDFGWEYAGGMKGQEMMMMELEHLAEELDYVEEELLAKQAEGMDVEAGLEHVYEARELLAELDLVEPDSTEAMDIMDRLEELGQEADETFEALGLGYLGPNMDEKKEMFFETVELGNEDALMDLLAVVTSEIGLENLLNMLLTNVSTTQLDALGEYGEMFGSVGITESKSFEFVDEENEALDNMIEQKLAILEELEAKVDMLTEKVATLEAEILELSNEIAATNWVGDSAEAVLDLQDEMEDTVSEMADAGASDSEIQEVLADYLDELTAIKEENNIEKVDLGLQPFIDTEDTAWYTGYVWGAMEEGIVSGYEDADGNPTGEYGPGNYVNNAEMAKIAIETADKDVQEGTPEDPYAQGDVWFKDYWYTAEQHDLSLTEDMMTDPGENASRATVVTTLLEAFDAPTSGCEDPGFNDMDTSHEHYEAVACAVEFGLVSGDDGAGTFRPDDPINRAEVGKVVDLSIELDEEGWE